MERFSSRKGNVFPRFTVGDAHHWGLVDFEKRCIPLVGREVGQPADIDAEQIRVLWIRLECESLASSVRECHGNTCAIQQDRVATRTERCILGVCDLDFGDAEIESPAVTKVEDLVGATAAIGTLNFKRYVRCRQIEIGKCKRQNSGLVIALQLNWYRFLRNVVMRIFCIDIEHPLAIVEQGRIDGSDDAVFDFSVRDHSFYFDRLAGFFIGLNRYPILGKFIMRVIDRSKDVDRLEDRLIVGR